MSSFSISLTAMPFTEHHVKRAVISCIDFRFQKADQDFIRSLADENFDHIKVPGAAKNFIVDTQLRKDLCSMIRNVCVGLHHIEELIILNHWDCGGYGGSKYFVSPDMERVAYVNDLKAASQFLSHEFPDLKSIVAYSEVVDDSLAYTIVE